jgi:hypothetical protein
MSKTTETATTLKQPMIISKTNEEEKQPYPVVPEILTTVERRASPTAANSTSTTNSDYEAKVLNEDPFSDTNSPSPQTPDIKEETKTTKKPHDINNLLSLDDLSNQVSSKDFPTHLIIVVHGIGAKEQILNKNLSKITSTIDSIRKSKKDYFKCAIHIKMIEWKSSLCPNVRDTIEKVTLQTNKKQRSMLNSVPTDLLFYLNPSHAQMILDEVAIQANATYEKMKEQCPNIKVSIIGHSLGSVITYDLLTKRTPNPTDKQASNITNPGIGFNFPIEHIFFIGSPLGVFISLNKADLVLLDDSRYCKGFYNIFHPNDLLAYRVEPLIDNYIDTPPYEVPFIKNDGLKKHKEKKAKKEKKMSFGILSFCTGRGNKASALEEQPSTIITYEKKEFKRYDYVLQEDYLESMVESLGMIGAHFGYWDSEDLFYFILKKLHTNLLF